MSTPELHEQFAVYVAGVLISHAQEIDFKLVAPDQVVQTILLDFAGVTPGPNLRQIMIKKAKPGESVESVDFEAIKANKLAVPVRLVGLISGLESETLCMIPGDVATTSGMGKNSEQTAEFVGSWSPFA
jgi:hypothetical protein